MAINPVRKTTNPVKVRRTNYTKIITKKIQPWTVVKETRPHLSDYSASVSNPYRA